MVFMRNIILLPIMSLLVLALAASILFLETFLNLELTDYSLIIWNFAVSIVIVVVVITVLRYRKMKKKNVRRWKMSPALPRTFYLK